MEKVIGEILTPALPLLSAKHLSSLVPNSSALEGMLHKLPDDKEKHMVRV